MFITFLLLAAPFNRSNSPFSFVWVWVTQHLSAGKTSRVILDGSSSLKISGFQLQNKQPLHTHALDSIVWFSVASGMSGNRVLFSPSWFVSTLSDKTVTSLVSLASGLSSSPLVSALQHFSRCLSSLVSSKCGLETVFQWCDLRAGSKYESSLVQHTRKSAD